MHYLNELSEKLVAAYQDQDNISQWISPYQTRQNSRQALAAVLRNVLEQEVARGCLSYDLLRGGARQEERMSADDLLSGLTGGA